MVAAPLKGAFGMASALYATTGYYIGMAIHCRDFLDLKAHDHPSWLYRHIGFAWDKARHPLQNAIMNKLTDSALKGDFSPRPVGDVLKRAAPSLLNVTMAMMPKLLSSPSTMMAVAMAGMFLLDEGTRQHLVQQAGQLTALFNTQTGDAVQQWENRHEPGPRPIRPDAQPSAF